VGRRASTSGRICPALWDIRRQSAGRQGCEPGGMANSCDRQYK
jgi:hypothetical protein